MTKRRNDKAIDEENILLMRNNATYLKYNTIKIII